MAKRHRTKRRPSATSSTVARRTVRLPRAVRAPITVTSIITPRAVPILAPLGVLSDRRRWHPGGARAQPAIATTRAAARHVTKQRPAFTQPSQTRALIGYADPRKVLSCVRRSTRKQVLFAKGVGGSSPRGFRKRRRTWLSNFTCS